MRDEEESIEGLCEEPKEVPRVQPTIVPSKKEQEVILCEPETGESVEELSKKPVQGLEENKSDEALCEERKEESTTRVCYAPYTENAEEAMEKPLGETMLRSDEKEQSEVPCEGQDAKMVVSKTKPSLRFMVGEMEVEDVKKVEEEKERLDCKEDSLVGGLDGIRRPHEEQRPKEGVANDQGKSINGRTKLYKCTKEGTKGGSVSKPEKDNDVASTNDAEEHRDLKDCGDNEKRPYVKEELEATMLVEKHVDTEEKGCRSDTFAGDNNREQTRESQEEMQGKTMPEDEHEKDANACGERQANNVHHVEEEDKVEMDGWQEAVEESKGVKMEILTEHLKTSARR
eukprot:Gb_27771 [translate_table: standard]